MCFEEVSSVTRRQAERCAEIFHGHAVRRSPSKVPACCRDPRRPGTKEAVAMIDHHAGEWSRRRDLQHTIAPTVCAQRNREQLEVPVKQSSDDMAGPARARARAFSDQPGEASTDVHQVGEDARGLASVTAEQPPERDPELWQCVEPTAVGDGTQDLKAEGDLGVLRRSRLGAGHQDDVAQRHTLRFLVQEREPTPPQRAIPAIRGAGSGPLFCHVDSETDGAGGDPEVLVSTIDHGSYPRPLVDGRDATQCVESVRERGYEVGAINDRANHAKCQQRWIFASASEAWLGGMVKSCGSPVPA
jgi:hypothetical protein